MSPKKKNQKPKAKIATVPARGGLFLLILTVLLGGSILYLILSSTTITITRESLPVEEQFTVRLVQAEDGAAERTDGDTPIISATLGTAEVTVSDSFTPSGTPERTEQPAHGTVTIYNNWSQTQPLAATTRLLSKDGVLFRLQERVDVPVGKSITAEIYADEPGTVGEVGPGRFTIPGLWLGLQDKIYAESTASTSGGVVEVKVLSDADITAANEKLTAAALTAAKEKIAAFDVPQEGLTLAEDSMQHVLIDTERDAELGEEVESFTMSRTEKVTGVFLNMDALQEQARTVLASRLSEDRILTEDAITIDFAFSGETPLKLPQDVAVTAHGTTLLQRDADVFAPRAFLSLSRARIQEYFAETEGVASVDVRFSPFWVTRAPENPAQITVKVQ